jgi:hypothetical protein
MRIFTILFCLFLFGSFSTKADAQTRYLDPVFDNVNVQGPVVAGSNFTILSWLFADPPGSGNTVRQPLVAEVYTPDGDTATDRPLVIYIHTGNFFPYPANGSCGGTLRDSSNVEIATRLASMGYVVAVVNYRQGWNPFAEEELVRRLFLINAAYRGVQDMRTFIRYFRRTADELGNPFGIDPDKIVLWGQGTGGYLSLATSYLNAYEQTLTTPDPNKFRIPTPFGMIPMVQPPYNGDIYGTSGPHIVDAIYNQFIPFRIGDTLSVPNHVGISSDFALGVNMGGALGDSTWVLESNMPTISFHVVTDPFAPCETDVLNVPTALGPQPVVEVSGSCHVQRRIDRFGLNDVFDQIPAGMDPYGDINNTRDIARKGFYPFVGTPDDTSAPWEWSASEDTPFTTGCNVDAVAARTYIDTIIGYYAPRACVALGLPCFTPASNTVVDIIQGSPDHTILATAINLAGLGDALSGEGPFTVFAPTDEAFGALPEGTLEAVIADPALLTAILTYHVVGAVALSTDLEDGMLVETLNGEQVKVTINEDGVFINNAQVTVADLVADNGVVHVINAVLLPPTEYETVGLIGSATELGWDASTPMEKISAHEWRLSITLENGFAKFRANNDWEVNWGSRDFPRGVGVQNGPDIPVVAGNYIVTFNSQFGDYFFDIDSDISIIGDATPGGWDADTKMFPVAGSDVEYTLTVDLVAGGLKFRQDQDWTVNWGSDEFPEGVATQDGPNIPIPSAGSYNISFNKETGEYLFTENIEYGSIGIIGSATPGGWDEETPMTKDANNPALWRVVISLSDGEAKFRADNSWDTNWGGEDFPVGIAEFGGPNIPVTAGDYIVTFNTNTFEYRFAEIVNYSRIGIIGDATPGGWDNDTPMDQNPEDISIWTLRVELTEGFLKFRAENDWAINWGSGDFPVGVGVQDGADVPIPGGEYNITFNSTTGEYVFEEIIEFGRISLVGESGPFGRWPDDTEDYDFFLEKDAADPNIWTGTEIELNDYEATPDGGVKFRAEADWTINWGDEDFPAGIGTQNGPNIRPIAGMWDVVFNSITGEYVFTPTSSTDDQISPADIKIYPNPANQSVIISLENTQIYGKTEIMIFNSNGALMFQRNEDIQGSVIIDISNLSPGMYFINLRNQNFLVNHKLMIAR